MVWKNTAVATFAISFPSCSFFFVFFFCYVEGEVRQLWLPLTVDSWLSWWHTCISCFTATRQLIRDQENSICWKWRGAFLQDHRFEVKIFVKWYPLTTRCMVLDSELFIRFEKKIVLCISLHLKLNWVHRDWNFLTKAFLEKWSFLHELFSILQSSKWSLLSLELVGWTLGVTCLFFFFLITKKWTCIYFL